MNLLPEPPAAREELPFTNRDELLRGFVEAIRTKKPDQHRVLTYYGIGGIGKTRLRDEFALLLDGDSERADDLDLLQNPGYRGRLRWAEIDFEETGMTDGPKALFEMRTRLSKKYGFRFPAFDLAYTEYWQKANPNAALSRKQLGLKEETSFLADIAGLVGDAPVLSVIANVPDLLQKVGRMLEERELKRVEQSLRQLTSKKAHEIAPELSYYWSLGLGEAKDQNAPQAILFLDHFETLRSGDLLPVHRRRSDEWVRKWIGWTPGVLWVISGRERLDWVDQNKDWESALVQNEVGDFSNEDTRALLARSGVDDTEIQNAVIETSRGVPFDVDLAINLYMSKRDKGETPEAKDFRGTTAKLHSRFFKYLNDAEFAALELLAAPRTWTVETYRILANRFDPGVAVGQFGRLLRFSFVRNVTEDTYTLHDRTREALRAHPTAEDAFTQGEVHHFLFEHFCSQFEDVAAKDLGLEHRTALEEAFYHARGIMSVDALADWFHEVQDPFERTANYAGLEQMYSVLLTLQECEGEQSMPIAVTRNNLAALYHVQGRHAEAKPLYEQALKSQEEQVGSHHPDVAMTLNNLAGLCHAHELHAELLYRRALIIQEEQLGSDHPEVAMTLSNWAMLHMRQGRYARAELMCKRALRIREEQLGPDHLDVAMTLNNLAGLYYTQGRYTKAESSHERALRVREEKLRPGHPLVATTLNNLAWLYDAQGRCSEAIQLYERAIAILDASLGPNHPNTKTTRRNLETCRQTCEEAEEV